MPGQKKIKPWLLPPLPGEDSESLEQRRNQAYFDEQREDTLEWFKRMDLELDATGLRVLDLGCGHGALSMRFAEIGAAEVLGLDLDESRIGFAQRNLETAFPQYRDRLEYRCQDVCELDTEGHYDLVVSKDTFEHIDDLPRVVAHLNRLLRPGGRLLAGFSPLYFSPFGDHGRYRIPVPWAHAVLPESLLVWILNRRSDTPVRNSMDIGLNRMTPAEFRRMFAEQDGWSSVDIRYNRGDKALLAVFDALRRIPLLERFFTVSIYARAVRAA